MFVRTADPADALEVRRIIDGAMLEPGDVEGRIAADDVFVAGDRLADPASGRRSDTGTTAADGRERLLGALVLDTRGPNAHVRAIAVRRRHRGRGIGRALIEAALERDGRLTARFDARVRPFYDALGFEIEPVDEDRLCGVLPRSDGDAPRDDPAPRSDADDSDADDGPGGDGPT